MLLIKYSAVQVKNNVFHSQKHQLENNHVRIGNCCYTHKYNYLQNTFEAAGRVFQQNTSSLQLSTDTEKAIHKPMLSGIVFWMTRLTTAPSHAMTAHVVIQLPHSEDFDKVGFFPFLEIKHIARNQPS